MQINIYVDKFIRGLGAPSLQVHSFIEDQTTRLMYELN